MSNLFTPKETYMSRNLSNHDKETFVTTVINGWHAISINWKDSRLYFAKRYTVIHYLKASYLQYISSKLFKHTR